MTGSSSKNVHSKVSLKGSRMTGSSSNNVHSKVSLKGSRVVCASINKKASRRQDHQILMFIVKYLKKAKE